MTETEIRVRISELLFNPAVHIGVLYANAIIQIRNCESRGGACRVCCVTSCAEMFMTVQVASCLSVQCMHCEMLVGVLRPKIIRIYPG